MRDDAARIEAYEARIAELAALVAAQAELIESLREMNERLEARVAELARQAGQNSGNSGKLPSRDTAAERQRQAEERQKRAQAGAGAKRPKGGCGHDSVAAFPEGVRAPVSYGPRVRATVAYLLGRQHLPTRRVAEAMAVLFGLRVSTGVVDSIYARDAPAPARLHHRHGGVHAHAAGAARR